MRREDVVDFAKSALVRIAVIAGVFACAYFFLGCARVFHNAALVSSDPVLVRSADPSYMFLAKIHRAYRLQSLVNLHGRLSKDERLFLRHNPDVTLHLFRWSAARKPPQEDIDRLVALYHNPKNFPMLIHCKAGADRTGLAVALYRIEIERRPPEEALAEMKFYRHISFLHPLMQNELDQRYGAKTWCLLWTNIKHLARLPITLARDFMWDLYLHTQ